MPVNNVNNVVPQMSVQPVTKNTNQKSYILDDNQPDSVELSTKKAKSKRNKIIAGAALAAGAVLVGIAVYKKKKAINEIPKDLQDLFKSLKNKNGKEFIDDAYSGLVKHMGLDDIAPANVEITDKADGLFNAVTGGFYPQENAIKYSKGFPTKLTKQQQFNMLSHELKHCKQFNQIVQTEGLGVEALADSIAGNSLQKNIFGMDIKETLTKEVGEEEAIKMINQEKEKRCAKLVTELKEKYSKTLSLDKFAADSPEGLQAKKYVEAINDYEGIGLFGVGSEKYRANLLEQEAYSFGDKMEEAYHTMQKPLSALIDNLKIWRKA